MKHISPTFIYIIPRYLRLTTFTKNPSPKMSFHLYLFAIFISLWGSIHVSADCWSAHRSLAARDSFKRVHGMAGWRRPRSPPNKNPGYAGDQVHSQDDPHTETLTPMSPTGKLVLKIDPRTWCCINTRARTAESKQD